MKVLIYDQHITGHNPSWLHAMGLAAQRRGCEVLVAAVDAPEVGCWLRRLSGIEHIAIEELGDVRIQLRHALELARVHGCGKLILPYIDFMLGGFNGVGDLLAAGPIDLGGIVLRPLPAVTGRGLRLRLGLLKMLRTASAKNQRRRIRGMLRQGLSRDLLEEHVARGNDVALMSLNSDEHRAQLGLSYPFARLGRLTADPWLSRSDLQQAEARAKACLPADRMIFLHCGTDDEAKGLEDMVAAWDLLPQEIRDRALLLRAGSVRSSALCQRIEARGKLINHYIEQADLDDLYAACDCVLLPYRHHTGTSGVLIHAAAARRPVIAPDHAVIGRLVAGHDLGLSYRHLDRADLARAIERMCREPHVPGPRAAAFAQANSLDAFCGQLGEFFF